MNVCDWGRASFPNHGYPERDYCSAAGGPPNVYPGDVAARDSL